MPARLPRWTACTTRRGTPGRLRDGGLSSEIHLVGEGGFRPLALLVTQGRWGDASQLVPVMQRIRVGRRAADTRAPGPAI